MAEDPLAFPTDPIPEAGVSFDYWIYEASISRRVKDLGSFVLPAQVKASVSHNALSSRPE